MFKKAFKIATAFGILMAGYSGYIRGFAILAAWLERPPYTFEVELLTQVESKTSLEATRLAEISFGKDHWSVKTPYRYYNKDRGYWMYAAELRREREGRRIVFKPFAIIWRSKDGRALKTVVGDQAVADFDQPFDAVKPGAKAGHVVHARISDRVEIRDDKGTPEDRADDLEIGPLTYLEFDEEDLQIRTTSAVSIKDRDLQASGLGLEIDLRPHSTPGRTGFNGAKTARLLKDVYLYAQNVGRSGILPGADKSRAAAGGPTPLDVRCAGALKIDFPPPRPPARPGEAPPPPDPTYAQFSRKVVVRRGTDRPDQLDCDELLLT
nr:hypothetical protein [Acidimicrobiia bacterium]